MKQKLIKMLSILGMSDYIRRVFSKKFKKLVASPHGISAFVVAISLPIIIYGTTYLIKYTKKSVVETNNFEIPYVIGKKLAQSYNPGKNWDKQKDYLYSVAAQIYNDGTFTSRLDHEKTIKAVAEPGNIELGEKKTIKSLCHYYETYSSHGGHNNWSPDNMLTNCPPFANFVYYENGNKIAYLKSVQKDGASEEDVVAYVVNEYKEDSDKLGISHSENDGDRKISVTCKGLKKKMEITLPRNDADIILAIPTNQKSNEISEKENEPSIRHIARASQAFLKYFLHTVGVAAGIVPYSGKVSISPARAESATTEILLNNNPNSGLTYVVQSVFYGSDGNMGGEIVHRSEEDNKKIYAWGDSTLGWPIMARRGQQLPYRNDMSLNSGAISKKTGSDSLLLDMTTSPDTADNYKFMQMNTNPCYLGFCNTLAMTCEKDCPTYMANPYFMTELTSDIQGLIYDLELFIPFKDEHNKSNFLFLPFVMAGNLFSWGNHPSDLNEQEVSRTKKKRYVIIIANAPDNFEPQEMTYLGFNNDYSEIPMFESDTILFAKGGYTYDKSTKTYTGAKCIVSFSVTSDTPQVDSGKGYLCPVGTTKAKISFPSKGLLKIVAERTPSTVEVFNDNGVEDNVGTHTINGETTLTFRGPQQIYNWTTDINNTKKNGKIFTSGNYTTKGPNFGHNLSVKKVKIKLSNSELTEATLTNQTLRFYGAYEKINNKDMIKSDFFMFISPTWQEANLDPRALDPGIDASLNYAPMTSNQEKNTKYKDDGELGWRFRPTSLPDKTSNDIGSESRTFKIDCYSVDNWSYSKEGNFEKYEKKGTTTDYCSNRTNPVDVLKKTPLVDVKMPSGSYYINAFKFNPKFYGIKKLKSFVYAAERISSYPGESNFAESLDADKSKKEIYVDDETKIGEIKENRNSSGDLCYNYISPNLTDFSNESFQISMGELYIKSRYYYQTFAAEKHRSRTVTQVVNVLKEYPNDSCNRPKKMCVSVADKKLEDGNPDIPNSAICECTKWEEPKESEDPLAYSYYPNVSDVSTAYGVDMSNWVRCNKVGICQNFFNYGGASSLNYYYVNGNSYYYNDWTVELQRDVLCNENYPEVEDTYTYTHNGQTQTSKKCHFLYKEGLNGNSECTYDDIEEPNVLSVVAANFAYKCTDSSDPCNCELVASVGKPDIQGIYWAETYSDDRGNYYDKKQLGALYKRDSLGFTSRIYEICNSDGSFCSKAFKKIDLSVYNENNKTTFTGGPDLRKDGTEDTSKTETSFYRYNLYNFFVVSGDTKTTEYTYSDGKPSPIIYSETDSVLKENKEIYLLKIFDPDTWSYVPDTYWVCFCGDAKLDLKFKSSSGDPYVKFSNINDKDYKFSLHNGPNTAGVKNNTQNSINEKEKVFYIHPDQISDTQDNEGNYYVNLEIGGKMWIRSIELTNRPLKVSSSTQYYAHPDIKGDGLTNTRIIDSPQQANATLTAYGKITHSSGSPEVSSVQGLFYNIGSGNVFIYPNSKADKAEVGEEGDFFIQLWDYGDLVPTAKWKIGSGQNPADKDVDTTDFGKFKSNYAFSGLHRMFFPYTTYNKNWGGYSGSTNIALVFAGYTLPINCILASNGYQNVFKVDDSSEPIKPNDALQNLAKDACTKLKGLTTDEGAPEIFLVKYKADFTYLDECIENKYSATNEEELTAVMEAIAQYIDSQTSELRVDVTDT